MKTMFSNCVIFRFSQARVRTTATAIRFPRQCPQNSFRIFLTGYESYKNHYIKPKVLSIECKKKNLVPVMPVEKGNNFLLSRKHKLSISIRLASQVASIGKSAPYTEVNSVT